MAFEGAQKGGARPEDSLDTGSRARCCRWTSEAGGYTRGQVFAELGQVEEPGLTSRTCNDAFQLIFAGGAQGHRRSLEAWRDRLDRFGEPDANRPERKCADYVAHQPGPHSLGEDAGLFEKYDLLLTPTSLSLLFPLGGLAADGSRAEVHPLNYLAFPTPSNLTASRRDPALRVDGGWIACRFADRGRRLEDATVLRAAAAFEEARPGRPLARLVAGSGGCRERQGRS